MSCRTSVTAVATLHSLLLYSPHCFYLFTLGPPTSSQFTTKENICIILWHSGINSVHWILILPSRPLQQLGFNIKKWRSLKRSFNAQSFLAEALVSRWEFSFNLTWTFCVNVDKITHSSSLSIHKIYEDILQSQNKSLIQGGFCFSLKEENRKLTFYIFGVWFLLYN